MQDISSVQKPAMEFNGGGIGYFIGTKETTVMTFLYISTAMLAGCFMLTVWNLLLFKKSQTSGRISARQGLPTISVLIPARNEERTIERCVRSLLDQDYPDFEVIVLDDESSDHTPEILAKLREEAPDRLRVINGRPLDSGWIGKNFACHQLSLHARGAWLTFSDADTIHKPHGLRMALELAEARGADLLTLIPEEIMITFGERLVLPLLYFTTFMFLPFYTIDHLRSSWFAVGIGQYMLFRKEAYESIGGHASVKEKIVEDIWLAREIKRHNFRLALADGMPIVSCRMYTEFAEVWRGFSKNMFAGFGNSFPLMAAALVVYGALFALPFVMLCVGLFLNILTPEQMILVLVQSAINILIRLILAVRFQHRRLDVLLHPFGIFAVIAIALNSWRWVAFGSGPRWKGRTYSGVSHDGDA